MISTSAVQYFSLKLKNKVQKFRAEKIDEKRDNFSCQILRPEIVYI